jgi:hypothetical protein
MYKRLVRFFHTTVLICFLSLTSFFITSTAFAKSEYNIQEPDPFSHIIIPSNVFKYTEIIIEEINILNSVLTVNVETNEADYNDGKSPIHVYSKALEVLEKVAKVQKKLGINPITKVGEIPIKTVKPADVFILARKILTELRRIKTSLVIEKEVKNIILVAGKTPSDVYHNLWRASYMLDLLTQTPLNPSDVHRNVLYIQDEIRLIAAKIRVPLSLQTPNIEVRRSPKNVAQQILMTLHKIVNLQKQLDMPTNPIPNISLVRIRPSDVYDLSNMALAELVRTKVRLNIQLPRGQRKPSTNKTSRDVFAQMLLINNNLSTIISMNSVF